MSSFAELGLELVLRGVPSWQSGEKARVSLYSNPYYLPRGSHYVSGKDLHRVFKPKARGVWVAIYLTDSAVIFDI